MLPAASSTAAAAAPSHGLWRTNCISVVFLAAGRSTAQHDLCFECSPEKRAVRPSAYAEAIRRGQSCLRAGTLPGLKRERGPERKARELVARTVSRRRDGSDARTSAHRWGRRGSRDKWQFFKLAFDSSPANFLMIILAPSSTCLAFFISSRERRKSLWNHCSYSDFTRNTFDLMSSQLSWFQRYLQTRPRAHNWKGKKKKEILIWRRFKVLPEIETNGHRLWIRLGP